jgi:hypothetical protein
LISAPHKIEPFVTESRQIYALKSDVKHILVVYIVEKNVHIEKLPFDETLKRKKKTRQESF